MHEDNLPLQSCAVTRKLDHPFLVPPGPNNYIEILGPLDNIILKYLDSPEQNFLDLLETSYPLIVLNRCLAHREIINLT